MCFSNLMLAMKSTGMAIHPNFLLLAKLSCLFLLAPLFACTVCGFSPMCVQTCICHMYYVVHSWSDLSRATIHLGMHVHPISKGKCKKSFEEVKSMVAKEVLHMPNVTSSAIALVASKTFLFCHLFNEDGEVLVELLKGEKINQTMLMFIPVCSHNIRNLISLFKHHMRNMDSLDSILVFKSLNPYDYI